MAFGQELWFALATSVLLLGPMLVMWITWSRSRGLRILLVAIGFTTFFLTDALLVAGQLVPTLEGLPTELIEFIGDIATAAAFAAAYVYPGAGPR